jgi:hypothetical protein
VINLAEKGLKIVNFLEWDLRMVCWCTVDAWEIMLEEKGWSDCCGNHSPQSHWEKAKEMAVMGWGLE